MSEAAAWLAARARSYHRDARAVEDMVGLSPLGGLTTEQWAIVYRTVAEELHKCAKEVGA